MNKDEALKMAKEMLLELNGHKLVTPNGHIVIDTSKQIKACKEALEHPAPKNCTSLDEFIAELEKDSDFKELMKQKRAELLALLKLEQPAQEPVAKGFIRSLVSIDKNGIETWKEEPFYTSPPSWQGLSDDEIDALEHNDFTCWGRDDLIIFARAIEQELKLKNGFNDIKEKNT